MTCLTTNEATIAYVLYDNQSGWNATEKVHLLRDESAGKKEETVGGLVNFIKHTSCTVQYITFRGRDFIIITRVASHRVK